MFRLDCLGLGTHFGLLNPEIRKPSNPKPETPHSKLQSGVVGLRALGFRVSGLRFGIISVYLNVQISILFRRARRNRVKL